MICPVCGEKGYRNGTRRGRVRMSCSSCGKNWTEQLEGSDALEARVPRENKVYLITCAQNATDPHPGWYALLEYARHRQASVIVHPIRYRNPTSHWTTGAKHDEWWHSEFHPYLTRARWDIGTHLTVLGDISSQPTSRFPVRQVQTMTRLKSAILPHVKIQYETVAVDASQDYPKIVTSTGACTVRNYTDTLTGKTNEADHDPGACLVEIDQDGNFHVRQIRFDEDGSFYDLHWHATQDGVTVDTDSVEALVCGDWHAPYGTDPTVRQATMHMIDDLHPDHVVVHDYLDFRSRNHHEIDNPLRMLRKHDIGEDDVSREISTACYILQNLAYQAPNIHVVRSNHDEALDRWLWTRDGRKDPVNMRVWFKAGHLALEHSPQAGVLEGWFREHYPGNNVHFLSRKNSLNIAGWELSFHGDKGASGARGSVNAWIKMGRKVATGHTHAPYAFFSSRGVGTMTPLVVGYTEGTIGKWLNTHLVLYRNGKDTLVSIIRGNYRRRE